jgi:hypothetical protein
MMLRWLTAIARRITREETFNALVAPALADLHFEAGARRPLAGHYTGLPVVIATALLRDLRIDVQLTFTAGHVWRRAAAWYGALIVGHAGLVLYLDTPWHLLDDAGRAAVLSIAVGRGILGALPMTMAATAFHLRRATMSHRAITVAVLCAAVAIVGFQFAAASMRPAVNQVVLDSASRVIAQGRPGAGLDDMNRYPGHWTHWLEDVRDRSSDSAAFRGDAELAAPSRTAAYALFVVPFAIFGAVLARARGWSVLFLSLALGATHIVAQLAALVLGTHLFGGMTASAEAVRELCASLAVALLWLFGSRLAAFRSVQQRLI